MTHSKLKLVLIFSTLALATFVAFEPVRRNNFVNHDDDKYITENRHIVDGITRESVVWAFTRPHCSMWHPLTTLTHMLDCELFGLNPFWHHLTNLLFHTANALLLFWILKRMTGEIWSSAFVAAAFALHPLQVESVAWAAERKNVLSGFFWMLTMAAYVRYAEQPNIRRYLLVFLVFFLCIMTKPIVVTLPFALLLLDYWPLCRFPYKDLSESKSGTVIFRRVSPWHLVGEKIPLFILSAVLSVITYIAQQSGGVMSGAVDLPLKFRVANALVSYISYIGKIIYPSRLAVLYPHPTDKLPHWQPIVSFVILAAVSAVIIHMARRRRYLAVGWLWYLVTLVPVIGLVQVGAQAMADRYAYLPSIGIFIMIACGAPEILSKWQYRKIVLAITAGIVVTAMLICSRLQISHWRNNLALFGRALAVTENNYAMHNSYGHTLLGMGNIPQAVDHFNAALSINPKYPTARANLGNVFLQQMKIQEAIASFKAVLDINKDIPMVYNNLGLAYAFEGRYVLAIRNFKEALRLEPNLVESKKNLILAVRKQTEIDEDIKKWKKLLETDPDNCGAHFNIGLAMAQRGEHDKAVRHFKEILILKPDSAGALNKLAWILAATEDTKIYNPADAVKFARRACELTNYRNAGALDTLAIAYAAAGRFGEAVATAEKAIKLAVSVGEKRLANEIQYRLRLYLTGRPYRQN